MQITFSDTADKYNREASSIYNSINRFIFVYNTELAGEVAEQMNSVFLHVTGLVFASLDENQNQQIKKTTVLLACFSFKHRKSTFWSFQRPLKCVVLWHCLLLSMFVLQNSTNQSNAVWQKSSKSSQTISLFGSEGSVDGNDWQRHLVCIHQCSFINSANSKS